MNQFNVSSIKRNEYICFCPWHSEGRETSPSLFINLKEDLAHCFAGCFKGTAREAIEKLVGFLPNRLEDAFTAPAGRGYSNTLSIFSLLQASTEETTDYLDKRGFTKETQTMWGITFEKQKNCIAIPAYRHSGKLVGIIYRQINPILGPKYIYSPGFPVSQILFGAHMLSQDPPLPKIHVVEGSLDCIWLWQNGFDAVALLGSSMSETQEKLLQYVSPRIVLCLDSDEAGTKAREKIAKRLLRLGIKVESVSLLPGKKDVQDHSPKELQKVLSTPTNYLMAKLNQFRV